MRQIQVATLPFVNDDVCQDTYYFFSWTTISCAGGVRAGMCGWVGTSARMPPGVVFAALMSFLD